MFGDLFSQGTMKKALMYMIVGPMALLFGGSMNFMDFMLIPMIAPFLKNLLAQAGVKLPTFNLGLAQAA